MSNESTRADRVIHQAAMIIRGGVVGGITATQRARELYNAGMLKDSTELIAGVEYCSLCGMELTECCDCIPQVEQDRMLYNAVTAEGHVHNWVHWVGQSYAGATCECGATQGDQQHHGRDEPAKIVPPAQERRVVNRMPRLRVAEARNQYGYLSVGQMVLVRDCYYPATIESVIGYGSLVRYEVRFTDKDPDLGTYRAIVTSANIFRVLS